MPGEFHTVEVGLGGLLVPGESGAADARLAQW